MLFRSSEEEALTLQDEGASALLGSYTDPFSDVGGVQRARPIRQSLHEVPETVLVREIARLVDEGSGELRDVLDLIARGRGNVVSVDHHREGRTTSAMQTEIELVVSTRDEAHCEELLEALRGEGRTIERVGPPS